MPPGAHEMREVQIAPHAGPRVRARRGVCASALVVLTWIALAAGPAVADEASDQPGSAAVATEKPVIETQINDLVRVLDTVQALDRPADGAEPLGRIRAGTRIEAIGIVAGGKWVQVQLPNDNLAYVPRQSMALDADGRPVTAIDKVTGGVSSVPNAATLVIGDKTVRLAGLDAGPATVLGPFESWVKGQGSLDCEPASGTGSFRCFTGKGIDVGEAAILNGAARVGDGATAVYREQEATARDGRKGLWGLP